MVASYYIIDHIKSKKYTAYLEKFTIEQLRSYSFFGWEWGRQNCRENQLESELIYMKNSF